MRVYVFQKTKGAHSMLRVVAHVSSPEFVVVSHRHSRDDVRLPQREQVAVETEAKTEEGDPNRPLRAIEGREDAVWRDRVLWESRNQDTLRTCRHLAILHHFLRYIDAVKFPSCLDQWSVLLEGVTASHLNGHCAAYAVMQGSPGTPLSWAFLRRVASDARGRTREATTTHADVQLTRLVKVCAGLEGWLTLNAENLDFYREFLHSHTRCLLDKRAVRDGYINGVALVLTRVSQFPGWVDTPYEVSPPRALAMLVEDIIAAVFKNDELQTLRKDVMRLLSSSAMFGMQSFVAQLRVEFLLQSEQSLPPSRRAINWAAHGYASVFEGAWILDGDHSLVVSLSRAASPWTPSLGDLLGIVREMARISIRPTGEQSLEVTSDWNVSCGIPVRGPLSEEKKSDAAPVRCGMTLVCDGQQRTFRNFPSGLSSMIPLGDLDFGFYRGKVISPTSLFLEFICWPAVRGSIGSQEPVPVALRLKVKADVLQQPSNGCDGLAMEVIVEQACCRVDGEDRVADFQAISMQQKHESIEAWTPVLVVRGAYNRSPTT